MSLTPCEEDLTRHDRAVEIKTLDTAARMVLEVSPEAARILRDAARLLLAAQIQDIQRTARR